MKLSNQEIYQIASINNANIFGDIYIPAKANFYIQKNLKTITSIAQEIDDARLKIAKHYGEPQNDEGTYVISQDKIPEASKELEDLFAIEQELDIKTFSIDALGNAEFTPAQMQAIMFMIED